MLTKEDLTVTVERDVAAAPAEVYRAFTNESALQYWLCDSADVDARMGGRIYLWWDKGYYSSGVYTDLDRNKTVAFTWRGAGDPEATEVRVSLAPHGDNGTRVTLTHSGLGPGEEWAEAVFQDRRGWESAFENLESVLETGVDLRISRRPMVGLNGFGEVNDELIARLGLTRVRGSLDLRPCGRDGRAKGWLATGRCHCEPGRPPCHGVRHVRKHDTKLSRRRED